MPLFMDIHRNVDKETTMQDVVDAHNADLEAQVGSDVRYLRWWFNQDLRSIYCLVDAPSAAAAVGVHRSAHGLVPDEIIPVEQGETNDLLGSDEHGPAVRTDPPGTMNADSAFRTIVFTDLEGSTTMTQRIGDEALMKLMRVHDEIMHKSLAEHGGNRVKHTGDGLMASFTSVASAVGCMVSMQTALASYTEATPDLPLRVRMGAAAGEPVADSEDLFGAAVQLAARLCQYAQPGQIVVAGVVRDLCIGKTFAFREHGEIEIKGFSEPVRVYDVRWQNQS